MVSSLALCPAQFSSEAPILDDRRHWLSWILGRGSFNVSRSESCGPKRVTFQQAFNSSPALKAAFAEVPSFEVCSAKEGPRYSVFHQHHLCGRLHSDLNVECLVTAVRRPWNSSHSEKSVRLKILLSFAARVLIASPCSVTTTASDDEFSIPTNSPGWNRGSHFPLLAGLAGMYKILSPNSRIGVLSFRPCSICSGVFPSLPMSHLFIRYAANSTSQHGILASGGILVPMRCSSAAFSVLADQPRVPLRAR